jgi:ribose transport system permease protein
MNETEEKPKLTLADRAKAALTKENLVKGAKYCWQNGSAYIILLFLVILFECFNPRFLSGQNLLNLISGSTFFMIAGMGIMFVMLTGGIDLSVSWQVSIVEVVAAICMTQLGWPIWAIWPVSILIGAACGFINGFLAAKLHLFPLIITLATSEVFKGIAFNITQGQSFQGMPAGFRSLYTTRFLNLPVDVYIAVLFIFVTWLVLNKTKFGRDVLAVGGSQEASRLSGIKVGLVTTLAYTLCGGIFAVAGLDMLAQENLAEATNSGIEFTCLTAAIIGGISMMGGKGNVMGMVVGIFIMQIIANGMQLAGFGPYAQYIIKGVILLVAVAFDFFKNMPRPQLALVSRKGKDKKDKKIKA